MSELSPLETGGNRLWKCVGLVGCILTSGLLWQPASPGERGTWPLGVVSQIRDSVSAFSLGFLCLGNELLPCMHLPPCGCSLTSLEVPGACDIICKTPGEALGHS